MKKRKIIDILGIVFLIIFILIKISDVSNGVDAGYN